MYFCCISLPANHPCGGILIQYVEKSHKVTKWLYYQSHTNDFAQQLFGRHHCAGEEGTERDLYWTLFHSLISGVELQWWAVVELLYLCLQLTVQASSEAYMLLTHVLSYEEMVLITTPPLARNASSYSFFSESQLLAWVTWISSIWSLLRIYDR